MVLLQAPNSHATDTSNPTIQSFTPSNGAGGVAINSNITIEFSESITAGVGSFSLFLSDSSTVVETFGIDSSTPTISWRTPKTFIAPFILDEKSLKATCSVPGRVSYDAQIGTKYESGIRSIRAVCIPTDTESWNVVESKLEFEVLSPTYRSSFLFKLNSSGLDSIEKVQVKAIQLELQKYGSLQCISYLNSNMLKIVKEVSLAKKRALAVCKALTIGTKIKYILSVSAIKGSPVATRRNLLKPFRIDVVLSN